MPVITMPARRCGKNFTHLQLLEMRLLNALFDTQAPMTVTELEHILRCKRGDLWQAIRRQYMLANIKKGQPVELTSSGHFAIAAGRLAGAEAVAA